MVEIFHTDGSYSLRSLIDRPGRVEWLVAGASTAYLIGTLWVTSLARLRERRWSRWMSAEPIPFGHAHRSTGVPFTQRASSRIQAHVTRLVRAADPSWGHDGEQVERLVRQVFNEIIYLGPALLDRSPPTYAEYRPTRTEGEFRDAIALPLSLFVASLMVASGA